MYVHFGLLISMPMESLCILERLDVLFKHAAIRRPCWRNVSQIIIMMIQFMISNYLIKMIQLNLV